MNWTLDSLKSQTIDLNEDHSRTKDSNCRQNRENSGQIYPQLASTVLNGTSGATLASTLPLLPSLRRSVYILSLSRDTCHLGGFKTLHC